MASSPSSLSGRRSRPGCMGSIAHLFDFNQALAGRKLLTDKKYEAGHDPIGDSSIDFPEPPLKSKSTTKRDSQLAKSASISRRSSEVPIKALMAEDISEELSKDSELKNRAPSVVARLMGLDELPHDSQNTHMKGLENNIEKVPSNRLQHGKVLAESTPSANMKLSRSSPMRSTSDLSTSKRSGWEERASSYGDYSIQSHSPEPGSGEEYGRWNNGLSKDQTHMQSLHDLDSQLAAKQMLIKKKLSEAKLGLLSKHSSPKEKLYESKEFMDAIDFLQANKDFFVRFLEEPDSLFAKHLRCREEGSFTENARGATKHTSGHSHGGQSRSWMKEPPDTMRWQHRTLGTDLLAPHKPMKGMGQTVSKHAEHHQAPTRIVVLKPGPGKVRNVMSLSQNNPRSPKEIFDAMEVIKENSLGVLQELKEKLQHEDARGKSRHTRMSMNEHTKALRDPREIAREIARQVRDNVTRDLRAHGSTSNKARSRKAYEPGGMPITITGSPKGSHELSGADYMDMSSSVLTNSLLDRKASHGVKDQPRRSLDQLMPFNTVKYHDSLCPPSFDHRIPRALHVDASSSGRASITAAHVGGYGDSSNLSPCDSEIDTYEEGVEHAVCRTLPRSRSVPTSSSFLHRAQKEVPKEDKRMPVSELCVSDGSDPGRPYKTLLHGDPLRRSVFRRRGSSSRGSFSKSKKQVKEVDTDPFSSHELLEGSTKCPGIESEKVQHQIDDSGPLPDSDSSISSVENFPTSEAATNGAEDMDMDKRLPSQLLSLATTEREEIELELDNPHVQIVKESEMVMHSSSMSPSKGTTLENDRTISVTSEANKTPFEQPSPVSTLDAPFHEEPESSMDFTEISTGLQGLRMRLELLKFVDEEAISNQEEYQEEEGHLIDDKPCAINVDVSGMAVVDLDLYGEQVMIPSSCLDGIACPQGKQPELKYVSNLLIASGFMGDHDTILTRWHAPSQPLAIHVFKKLEEKEKAGGLSPHSRNLLFDSVNEVLLDILGPLVNSRTSWTATYVSAAAFVMPSGEDLVRQVWAGICRCSQGEGQDTLGNLVAKDLAGRDQWCDLRTEVEMIVLGVERAIYGDLIEEIFTM